MAGSGLAFLDLAANQVEFAAQLQAATAPSFEKIGLKLEAVTLGANVWFNGWTRWQINAIEEHFDGRGNGPFKAGAGWRPTVLSQLQVKF